MEVFVRLRGKAGWLLLWPWRAVDIQRYGAKVKQETLLHLGSKFPVEESDWPTLCRRIEELLQGQVSLLRPLPKPLEDRAEAIVVQLFAKQAEQLRQAKLAQGEPLDPSWHTVDVASTRMSMVQSVGVEHVSVWALKQLGVPKLLRALGMTPKTQRAVLGAIVGRLAKPASERATYAWLCNESGLGEFLGGSLQRMSLMHLYRASDQLVKHRDAIESHVFTEAMSLFGLACTVTLFDLTNSVPRKCMEVVLGRK